MKTTFRDLKIGDTFDFVDPINPMHNSYFAPCRKLSARAYCSTLHDHLKVGSINTEVFHVNQVDCPEVIKLSSVG